MRSLPLSLATVLALGAIAMPSQAADRQSSPQSNQARKIWTNDDLDQLRARGLISIVGPFPELAPEAVPQAAPPTTHPPAAPYVPTQDPNWYADQAAQLQAELEEAQAAVRQAWGSRRKMELRSWRRGLAKFRASWMTSPTSPGGTTSHPACSGGKPVQGPASAIFSSRRVSSPAAGFVRAEAAGSCGRLC
jgi:hypothetical protein